MSPQLQFARLVLCLVGLLASVLPARAQTTFNVGSEAVLRAALSTAVAGDSIVFTGNITLTTGDLPAVIDSITIDGSGFTLSGNHQFRGFFVGAIDDGEGQPITVTIQNITIANTLAAGGAGGDGSSGGGGGAGLGGALYVAQQATVTVSNVRIITSAALGGSGGSVVGVSGGGGGGLGGDGGSGVLAPGGGGGVGNTATGGSDSDGGAGILTNGGSGGTSSFSSGGANGGGGGSSTEGGAGGGEFGGDAGSGFAGGGGYGGGGGGADGIGFGAPGGFGGGGGGGGGGDGGYGGGGGGSPAGGAGFGGFGGGAGADSVAGGGGGGGAGLGGGVFVESGGILSIAGGFTVNGNSVAGGAGGPGAENGLAAGAGMFFGGFGLLAVTTAPGDTVVIEGFSDEAGALSGGADPDFGSWGLYKDGAGTLVLSGANTYTDGTFVEAGTLSVTTGANLGFGDVRLNSLATLAITGSGLFSQPLFLQDAPTVAVATGQTATWMGEVADNDGPGTLRVTGGGTLQLSNNNNSYSGGTFVAGGSTVAVAVDSALGAAGTAVTLGDAFTSGGLRFLPGSSLSTARPVFLASGGGVIDTAGDAAVTLTALTGAGALVKAGTGTLTLGGSTAYGGPTIVNGGLLRTGVANLFNPGASLSIAGGATVDLNGFNQSAGSLFGGGSLALGGASFTVGGNNSSSSFGGTISGAGALVKVGSGTLALSGSTSHSGGTFVTGGALVGTTSSLQGTIVNDALVVFDQAGTGTYAGTMSGSGALAKAGQGTVVLTGPNSYSGGTLIAAGTLVGSTASLQGTVVNDAQLTFAQGFDGAFLGVLAGGGALRKEGAGTLTLTGNHPFSGTTTVAQGALAVNGVLGGQFAVEGGGTLFASGTVLGSMVIDGGGLIVPPAPTVTFDEPAPVSWLAATTQASAPALIVGGDFITGDGSRVGLTVAPGTIAPIIVGGSASLTGTELDVSVNDTLPQRATSYLALSAVNGLRVTESSAVTQLPGYAALLANDESNLFVTLLNFQVPLVTGDPGGVGGALDRLKFSPGEMGGIIRELYALDDDDLDDALRQIAGEIHSSALRMVAIDSETFTDFVRRSLSRREVTDAGSPVFGLRGVRWWAHVGGQRARFQPRDGIAGGVADLGTSAGGLDWKLSERFSFGGGAGYGRGNMGLEGLAATSDFSAPRAFGYGGFHPKGFKIRAGGSLARTKNETKRRIAFAARLPLELGAQLITGGFDREALSEQVGLASDVWSEYEDELSIGSWTMEGTLGVRRAEFGREEATESGAGAFALELVKQAFSLTQTDLRIHVFRGEGRYRPYLETTYRRLLTSGIVETALEFAGVPGGGFVVQGIPFPGNSISARAGMTTVLPYGLQMTVEVEYQHARDESRRSADLRVRFR